MFPLNSNQPYIKDDGTRDRLGNVIGSGGGGGGGTVTPDYEHKKLLVGIDEGFQYYVPMSREYVGDDIYGYEIKTNPGSTSSYAKIDLYEIVYSTADGVIYSDFVKTLVHNGDKDYEDDNIAITYSGSQWSVTCKVDLYDTSGEKYTSPVQWTYSTTVDKIMLTEDPTA